MTALTEAGSLKVKNPNPRDRPVSASRMIVQCVTSPNCSKYILSVSEWSEGRIEKSQFSSPTSRTVERKPASAPSVVSQFKPPMNIFLQRCQRWITRE